MSTVPVKELLRRLEGLRRIRKEDLYRDPSHPLLRGEVQGLEYAIETVQRLVKEQERGT